MCTETGSGDPDINLTIAEIARFLRRAAGEKLNLRTQLDPGAYRARVDSKLVAWLFLTLGASACETMPAGGELDIVTSNVTLDSAAAREARLKPGSYLRIEITTRGGRMESGLVARAIIEQAEGAISIYTIGADVVVARVMLPSIVRSVPSPPQRRNSRLPATHGAARVILVVDDDPAQRALAREALEAAGYEIVEAANGREAETVLSEIHIDLMITDIVMPEQDGLETIKSVRKAYPSLRIIAMSETAGGYQLRAAKHLGADAIIVKPLSHGILGEVVRTELDPE